MERRFLTEDSPPLIAMMGDTTPKGLMAQMRDAIKEGAEGFCLLLEKIEEKHRCADTWRSLFAAAEGRPVYVTNYRHSANEGKPDERLAEELLLMAECGADLCDVMGDLFDPTPGEWTENPAAIQKQKELISRIHERGADALMSSHILAFTPAERVLAIAKGQKERGADVCKIVTGAESMEEQIENLRITNLLKQELGAPFLFLAGGECHLSRRLGGTLGNCMTLCVKPTKETPAPIQPALGEMHAIRDLFPIR
jgi:3-dehydroquinate dehydratase